MRKAALIYNPSSGRQRERRLAEIHAAADVLQAAGVAVQMVESAGPRDAGQQARQLIAEGSDSIVACGGDGTIHDVLQGVVHSPATLGVIPMGTANALAHDLGIPLNPVQAARAALTAEARRVAVGQIGFHDRSGRERSHYFVVAAGIGADAQLFYRLQTALKQRIGMSAYYAQALRLWLTHPFASFEAEFVDGRTGELRQEVVSQALAVRITEFGGVLRKLAPEAALRRPDVQLVLFKTCSRVPYLLYMFKAMLDGNWQVPGVELVHTTHLVCRPLNGSNGQRGAARIYAEADGELLGRLPIEITIVPHAVTLLVPQRYAPAKLRDKLIAHPAPPVSDAVS